MGGYLEGVQVDILCCGRMVVELVGAVVVVVGTVAVGAVVVGHKDFED
jgi:hypothetical protein